MKMIGLSILLLTLSYSIATNSASNIVAIENPEITKISNTIGTLQPELGQNRDKLRQLSVAIFNNAKKFDIDWKIAVAIFYQESSLKLDPKNCLKTKNCNDLGIGQVRYSVWGKALKIDKKKMLTDVHYAVGKSFDVLHHYKLQYADRELNWYTRYHSGTSEHRAVYQYWLNRAYSKINSVQH